MSKVDTFLTTATAQLGRPYVFGADDPARGFDCSGLTEFAAAAVGINLPHNAAQQQQLTTRVSTPLPGDLVFFGDPAYHVGIYLGQGRMISAPHSGATVHVVDVGTPTSYGRISGLGTITGPIIDTVGLGVQTVGASISDVLGGVRATVLEAAVVVLGLGLVGFGLYRALVVPNRERLDAKIGELL